MQGLVTDDDPASLLMFKHDEQHFVFAIDRDVVFYPPKSIGNIADLVEVLESWMFKIASHGLSGEGLGFEGFADSHGVDGLVEEAICLRIDRCTSEGEVLTFAMEHVLVDLLDTFGSLVVVDVECCSVLWQEAQEVGE